MSATVAKLEIKIGKNKFKRIAIRGGKFTYKAKNLPDTGTTRATVKLTAADGTVIQQKIKIISAR